VLQGEEDEAAFKAGGVVEEDNPPAWARGYKEEWAEGLTGGVSEGSAETERGGGGESGRYWDSEVFIPKEYRMTDKELAAEARTQHEREQRRSHPTPHTPHPTPETRDARRESPEGCHERGPPTRVRNADCKVLMIFQPRNPKPATSTAGC